MALLCTCLPFALQADTQSQKNTSLQSVWIRALPRCPWAKLYKLSLSLRSSFLIHQTWVIPLSKNGVGIKVDGSCVESMEEASLEFHPDPTGSTVMLWPWGCKTTEFQDNKAELSPDCELLELLMWYQTSMADPGDRFLLANQWSQTFVLTITW